MRSVKGILDRTIGFNGAYVSECFTCLLIPTSTHEPQRRLRNEIDETQRKYAKHCRNSTNHSPIVLRMHTHVNTIQANENLCWCILLELYLPEKKIPMCKSSKFQRRLPNLSELLTDHVILVLQFQHSTRLPGNY